MKRFIAGLVACMAASRLNAPPTAAEQRDAQGPRAVVIEYEGIIHPVAVEFIDEAITRADTSGAAILVLVLRTPASVSSGFR